MLPFRSSSAYIIFILILISKTYCDDEFTEELYIKPLPNGFVYAHFQFTVLRDVNPLNQIQNHYYHLFPKSLGEIISKYNVRELHLSLTQGLWKHKHWGYPFEDSPPGVELWAWFHEWTPDVNDSWSDLTHSLSGLFCASLNFIDTSNSASPQSSFRPRGVASESFASNGSHYLRYSSLPREIVCTENLTPWKKLLPCASKAGLTKLLNSAHLFNTNYHSLAVHVRPKCRDTKCKTISLEMIQTVSLVYETAYGSRGKQDWSFNRLFGLEVTERCPMATSSKVYVDISSNETQGTFSLTPPPAHVVSASRSGEKKSIAVYDLRQLSPNRSLQIASTYNSTIIYSVVSSPKIYMQRYITGYGQESGGIRTQLHNSQYQKEQTVIYMELIPWFFRIYLHTLKIRSGYKIIKPIHINYVPSRDRQQPTLLEVTFSLPANSITHLNFEFERAMLKWTEYPPDANHGFYIGSAVLTTQLDSARNYSSLTQHDSTIWNSLNNSQSFYFLRLHSEQLLVSLPTPDFSMPYNVICLTCTVVAIAFGPIHNLTTKRLQIGSHKLSLIGRLKNKAMSLLGISKEKTE